MPDEHGQAQRVLRLGPVHRHDGGRAPALEGQVLGAGLGHRLRCRSRMVPVASAPPQHMEIRANCPSRRSSSCRAVVIEPAAGRADRVAEGDGPAVDVHLVHVRLVDLGPRAARPRRRPRSPRRCPCPPSSSRPWPAPWPWRRSGRRGGSRGRIPPAPGPRSGPGAAAPRRGPAPRTSTAPRPHRRRSATSCRPCGCRRAATGFSLASPSAVVSRSPWSRGDHLTLAGRTVGPDHGRLDRDHLSLEAALVPGARRVLLRGQAEGVDLLAGDAALGGDALGRAELVGHVPGEVVRARRPGAVEDVGPEPDPAHGLDPAGDADVDGADARSGWRRSGWPAGPSRTGSRWWWPPPRRAGAWRSQAVRVTFDACSPAWVTQPPTTCSTVGGVDAGALDQLDLRGAEQLGGVQAREPAVALADRRAHRLDDDGLAIARPP